MEKSDKIAESQLGKLEMKNIVAGYQEGPAPTTETTEHYASTTWLGVFGDLTPRGDSYPDGCCE